MSTLATPTTPAEQAEVDFGDHAIWRLVNSRIVQFGANEKGEIFLSTEKDGKRDEFVIGIDERGDIALYEIEKKEVPAPEARDWPEDGRPDGSGLYMNRCFKCGNTFNGYKRRPVCKVCATEGGGA